VDAPRAQPYAPPVRRVGAAMALVAMMLAACGGGSGKPSAGKTGAKPARVTAVSQNILHGGACPAETDRCHIRDRVALFTRQLADAHCP
jgi:hypothetical protein